MQLLNLIYLFCREEVISDPVASPKKGDESCSDNLEYGEEQKGLKVEQKITEGQTFESFGQFDKVFKEYCKQGYMFLRKHSTQKNLDPITSTNFPYKRMRYTCIHWGERPATKGKEIRPNFSYNARGCKFELKVSFFKAQGHYKVTYLNNEHENHECNETYYRSVARGRKLDEKDEEYYRSLHSLGMSKQSVIKLVGKNLGKVITMQDMSNIINKKKPRKDDSDLDRTIEYLKQKHEADFGSELQIVYKDDSSHKIVKIIFYMSSSMKDLIDQCGSVLHIDGTYCLSKDRYIMYPFVVSDQFNVSRICAWALCSDEKSDTLQGVLQLFKNAIGDELSSKIEYLILDKDFGELQSATSILPGAKFVLCKYHVLTYVKEYVRKICLPSNLQQIKDTIFQYFSQMLYADTEDAYFDSWRSLCSLSNHHENIKLAISYFDRNWHANREMWSFYIIKTYKIRKNHTNNRIEGKNKQLKGEIGRSKSLLFISQKMFDIAQNECNDMMIRKVNAKNKTFWPSTIGSREEEEIMKEGGKYLGKEVLQKVLIELRSIASFDDELDYSTGQTKCPRIRGVCYSNASDVIPCKHLFKVRLYNSEKLIEKSMFGKFWMLHTTENAALKKKVSKSSIFQNFSKLTSQNSKPKHKDLKKVLNPLIEDISCKPLEPGFSNHGSRPKIGSRRTSVWVGGMKMGRMGRGPKNGSRTEIFDGAFFLEKKIFLMAFFF